MDGKKETLINEPWGERPYRMLKLCLLYVAATSVGGVMPQAVWLKKMRILEEFNDLNAQL